MNSPLRRSLLLALSMLFVVTACSRDGEDPGTKGIGVEPTATPGEFGRYHALLIGIDGYSHWPPLRFAETDAADIGDLLESRYGFARENVTRLLGRDATRARILGAIRQKLESLGEQDNLLIYYAGHGQLDPLTDSGYWVPVDGDLYDDSSWVPFTSVTSFLSAANVRAKNVIVITDSCYGAALTRAGPTPGNPRPGGDAAQYIAKLAALAAKRSRQVIASGGYEQVPDESLFAALLKQALRGNEYPAVDLELLFFAEIYPQLRVGGQQEARMSRVVSGPEVSGQFVLVRSDEEAAPPEPGRLTVRSEPTGHRVLINGEARGETPASAELPAGNYIVRVEANGFVPYEEELSLAAGDERVVEARLVREREDPPTVELEIAPREVRAGDKYTLTWRSDNARAVEITSLGAVSLSGTRELVASASVTYEITALGVDDQRASARADVSVKPGLPTIDYFVAKPEAIEAGQATSLVWRTTDAAAAYIEGFGSVSTSGFQDLRPTATTTYQLVAVNDLKESVQQSVTISVKAVPAPEIVAFEARPSTVTAGGSAELVWRARGQRAEILNVGAVPLDGSYKVGPTATTTYTLVVRNSAGASVERTATVTVEPSRPTGPVTSGIDRIQTSVLRESVSRIGAVAAPRAQGTLSIRQTFLADLDRGAIVSDGTSDLWFAADTATARYLQPMNGAALAAVRATTAPGLAGCRGATLGTGRLPVSRLAVGTFLCVRTNEGRVSQLEITEAPGPSPGTLTVNYVTWN